MRKIFILTLLTIAICLPSCGNDDDDPNTAICPVGNEWEADSMWYESSDTINEQRIDLFYLVSTEVISATASDGSTSYVSLLTPADRSAIKGEMEYIKKQIGQGDVNFISPYYHQFTFDAISLPTDEFSDVYEDVSEEVCNAFDHYMQHTNHGRPFVIAGFSQGASLVLDLLRHMTDEQYSHLVGAYAMGYRVSATDTLCAHIRPATDATTRGVTVSFNSVLTADAIWPFVTEGAVTCINPVNWTVDATPATFTYDGHEHTVSGDTTAHVLIVNTDNAEAYRQWTANPVFQKAGVSPDCLHHYDLLFYCNQLHDNMMERARH